MYGEQDSTQDCYRGSTRAGIFYQAAGDCALLYWTIFRCMQRVSEREASCSGVVDNSDVCFWSDVNEDPSICSRSILSSTPRPSLESIATLRVFFTPEGVRKRQKDAHTSGVTLCGHSVTLFRPSTYLREFQPLKLPPLPSLGSARADRRFGGIWEFQPKPTRA